MQPPLSSARSRKSWPKAAPAPPISAAMPARRTSAPPSPPRSAKQTSSAAMKRAVTHLLAAIAALPILLSVAAAGPPGHPVRIGVLGMTSPSFDPAENAFARELIEGLRELGYSRGRDYIIEYRSVLGHPESWPA